MTDSKSIRATFLEGLRNYPSSLAKLEAVFPQGTETTRYKNYNIRHLDPFTGKYREFEEVEETTPVESDMESMNELLTQFRRLGARYEECCAEKNHFDAYQKDIVKPYSTLYRVTAEVLAERLIGFCKDVDEFVRDYEMYTAEKERDAGHNPVKWMELRKRRKAMEERVEELAGNMEAFWRETMWRVHNKLALGGRRS